MEPIVYVYHNEVGIQKEIELGTGRLLGDLNTHVTEITVAVSTYLYMGTGSWRGL
jgi:hypothetical protein